MKKTTRELEQERDALSFAVASIIERSEHVRDRRAMQDLDAEIMRDRRRLAEVVAELQRRHQRQADRFMRRVDLEEMMRAADARRGERRLKLMNLLAEATLRHGRAVALRGW